MATPKIESLRFEGLTFSYENSAPIFQGLDFEFPMNRLVWFNAESGQGRSSLLQLLGALRFPDSGFVCLNDMKVSDMSFEEFLPYRLKIGYSFDFGGLLNNKTIFENLTLPLMYHKILDIESANKRVLEYLKFLAIDKYKDQRPAVVPGGVRKITCMLRALILHPDVLLLDDPSVGMNESTFLRYFDLIKKIQSEGALRHIFVSSFDKKLMGLLGSTEVVIDDGRLYLNESQEKYAVNT